VVGLVADALGDPPGCRLDARLWVVVAAV